MTINREELQQHAATCGRLDCGHLYRSDSQAVRRATLLYLAENQGVEFDLDDESAEVAAVLGVLRASEHAVPVYTRGTLQSGNRGYVRPNTVSAVLPLPDVSGLRLTPERREVYAAAWMGLSASEIAEETLRTRETVRSHMGNLRRKTGAHDAPSALVALVLAGEIAVN